METASHPQFLCYIHTVYYTIFIWQIGSYHSLYQFILQTFYALFAVQHILHQNINPVRANEQAPLREYYH